jgi:putative methyltransferase
MSLYYEAAAVLANTENAGGSLKSRIYGKKDLKSTPGQLFALIAETSKWSVVLKDVIEKCKLLAEERKVICCQHNVLPSFANSLRCSLRQSLLSF